MKRRDFQDSLGRHGPDLAAWPAGLRHSAEQLLSESAEARASLSAARRIAVLMRSAWIPPAPSIDPIVEHATAQSRVTGHRAVPARSDWAWLPASRWYAAAFAACMILGIALGVASAQDRALPGAVYNLIDGSGIGAGDD